MSSLSACSTVPLSNYRQTGLQTLEQAAGVPLAPQAGPASPPVASGQPQPSGRCQQPPPMYSTVQLAAMTDAQLQAAAVVRLQWLRDCGEGHAGP